MKKFIMKITRTLITCLLLGTGNVLLAQNNFVEDGTIEFEKSVNTFAIMKKQLDSEKSMQAYFLPIFEQHKKTQPQFKVLKSTLSFSKDKTLFEPITGIDKPLPFLSGNPAVEQYNTVYTDLSAGSMVNQKLVFEQTFLLKDNTRKIIWKITDETREIAGYNCRRANGIMLDSIYVVAFYTISIPVSGGPESFSGLPGMILGVALPHENITWFATKVTGKAVTPLKIPAKGKVVTNKELEATLQTALKNRGTPTQMQTILKAFLL